MTIEDIRTFITLAQTSSFSRTAELMFTSQSAISSRLKSVETQLGSQLISRSTKRVELTPAGLDFLNYAVQIVRLYSEGMQAVRISGGYAHRLAIGAPESIWDWLLFPSLLPFISSRDDISFTLYEGNSASINQRIVEGNLDVGVGMIPLQHPNAVSSLLFRDSFVLVAHRELPLPPVTFSRTTISQFPFIRYDLGPAFQSWFSENYFKQAHFIEVERISLYLHLLRSQTGIGFLPLRIAQRYLESGELIQLRYEHMDQAPTEEVYLLYHKRGEVLVEPVLTEIRHYVDHSALHRP